MEKVIIEGNESMGKEMMTKKILEEIKDPIFSRKETYNKTGNLKAMM
jgi:hypothetical protein